MHIERDTYSLKLLHQGIIPEIRKQLKCVPVDVAQLFVCVFAEPINYLLTKTTIHLIVEVFQSEK